MRFFSRLFLVLALALGVTAPLYAKLTVHVGPPAYGGGGPNPVDIPPISLPNYEVVWLRSDNSEWTFGLIPGVFWGRRFTAANGGYFSIGGGGVVSLNGVGPGIYSAFGADLCGLICFNIEYKKALGVEFSDWNHIAPYAVRAGVTFEF